MIRILLTMLVILYAFNSNGQDIPFKFYNPDTTKYQIIEVQKNDFDSFIERSKVALDSNLSEKEFSLSYGKLYQKTDSCFVFKSKKGKPFELCRIQTADPHYKGNVNYKFVGTLCGNAIISGWGYEDWWTTVVDLNTGLALRCTDIPKTSNCKVAISTTNYYGDEYIDLINLEEMELDMLSFPNFSWTTKSIKSNENRFMIQLEMFDRKKEFRYLSVTFK
ncbi:MAG: hypothetical protein NXI20_00010 [bacterium]|nr:hypothetical protein [bacterium]